MVVKSLLGSYSEMSLLELATEDGSRLLAREGQASLQVTVRLAKKSFSYRAIRQQSRTRENYKAAAVN